MATVVRHTKTDRQFILVGTGFGAFQSKKPNWLLGDLVADTSEGQYAMVCVCDQNGRIAWIASAEVIVESVDGQRVQDLFE